MHDDFAEVCMDSAHMGKLFRFKEEGHSAWDPLLPLLWALW